MVSNKLKCEVGHDSYASFPFCTHKSLTPSLVYFPSVGFLYFPNIKRKKRWKSRVWKVSCVYFPLLSFPLPFPFSQPFTSSPLSYSHSPTPSRPLPSFLSLPSASYPAALATCFLRPSEPLTRRTSLVTAFLSEAFALKRRSCFVLKCFFSLQEWKTDFLYMIFCFVI